MNDPYYLISWNINQADSFYYESSLKNAITEQPEFINSIARVYELVEITPEELLQRASKVVAAPTDT